MILAGFGWLSTAKAQEQAQYFSPIVLPSPTVASLGVFGNATTEKATGAPAIDVPIYSLKVKDNYAIDFSLHYSRNGIRVDEIPGTAGAGWAFNGVFAISRVIFDDPDELAYDWTKKLDNGFNIDSLNNLIDMGMLAGFDIQPDLFSLVAPGFSGRFFLSGDTGVFLNRNTSYKIQRIPAYGFKVTDGNGNILWFGGTATEKSRTKISCPGQFNFPDNAMYNTAWFLNNIITPVKDTISFGYSPLGYDYQTAVMKTKVLSWKELEYTSSCRCSGMSDQECIARTTTETYRLNWIKSKNIRVTFGDVLRKDNLSDRLLGGMSVYSTIGGKDSLLQNTRFEYQYGLNRQRPYLSAVKTFGGAQEDSVCYNISYINIDNLPDLLVDQTDYWGYYNGGGNRLANPAVSAYGMLNKIVYPTGGYDSVVYESNMKYERSQISSDKPLAYLQGYGLSDHSLKQYIAYKTIYSKDGGMRWSGQCQWIGGGGPDQMMHKMIVEIRSAITNVLYTSITVEPGNYLNYTNIPMTNIFNAGDSAQLKFILNVYGEQVRGEISINQIQNQDVWYDKPYGGVRVKKILTVSTTGDVQVKKYSYQNFLNKDASSGSQNAYPELDEELYTKNICVGNGTTPGGSTTGTSICYYKLQHDKSMLNLFSYTNSPMLYYNVTESFGENMENGMIQYEFDLRLPIPAAPVYGAQVGNYSSASSYPAAPFTLLRDLLAVEKTRKYYRKTATGEKMIKRKDITYDWNSFIVRKGYTIRQRVFNSGADATPRELYTKFDVNRFDLNSSFLITKKEVDSVFGDDGSNMAQTKEYFYDFFPRNVNLSRIEQMTSTNDTIKQYYNYADNYKGQLVYDTMVQRNMLNNIVESWETKAAKPIIRHKVNYVLNQGLVLRDNIQEKNGSSAFFEIYKFHKYDDKGNIQERSATNDMHEVYLWGYQSQYPVAKITGTTWGSVNGIANQTLLDNAYNYSDIQIRTELDKVRTAMNNKPVKVVTYTYDSRGNITSETDAGGKVTYYEYDALGRLIVIRNQDGKILKRNVYKYRESN